MKTALLIISCCVLSPILWAQKHNNPIPAQVVQQFAQRFGNANQVEWIASTNERYKAQFYQEGIKKNVLFANSGQWLVIENPVTRYDIPSSVYKSLTKSYPDYQVGQVTRMELFGKGISFRIRIRKGNSIFDIEIDANGKVGRRIEVFEDEHCHHHHDCHHGSHHKEKHKHKHKHGKGHEHHDEDND